LIHIDALKTLKDFGSTPIDDSLEYLTNLGMDRQLASECLCGDVLAAFRYETYGFCAARVPRFINQVDQQIYTMLEGYYSHRKNPYHSFEHLSALVNKDELLGDISSDAGIIRERIKAKLENSRCRPDDSGCRIPVSFVEPVVRAFVYSCVFPTDFD